VLRIVEERGPTPVLQLKSMITSDEVEDDVEYNEIAEDVIVECEKTGRVLSMIIPRFKDGYPQEEQGNIYVEFDSSTVATTCAVKMTGRKFGDQAITVDFTPEVIYDKWKRQFPHTILPRK